MTKAVFLDRDGVINKMFMRMGKLRAPYSLEEFAYCDGVEEAIHNLKNAGFVLVIVTNQPDVARGWVAMEHVEAVNQFISSSLPIDEIRACFHTEKDQCECRKPKAGMLLEAARKWNIDCSKSFMVGDRITDIQAGHTAGCQSILVGEGEDISVTRPDHACANLLEASRWILRIV